MKIPIAAPTTFVFYKMRTERCCKRPARIHAAGDHHIDLETAAYHEEIPACEIESGEGDVSCTNHERNKEIPQHCWCYWYKKKEHHDDAVNREELVIGVRGYQIAGRSQQFESNQ